MVQRSREILNLQVGKLIPFFTKEKSASHVTRLLVESGVNFRSILFSIS